MSDPYYCNSTRNGFFCGKRASHAGRHVAYGLDGNGKRRYITSWKQLPQLLPCDQCNAEAGEPCRPYCIGEAAYRE